MKVIIVLSILCGLGMSVMADVPCGQNVTEAITTCTSAGSEAQKEQDCVVAAVIDYIDCQHPQEAIQIMSRAGGDGTAKMTKIKCIVVTSIDMFKCFVQELLKAPFTWDWPAITKCLTTYSPAYLGCK
ncbi:uncharacterized protein LOC110379423 [Helicoverpa armigera]|uniref:uncharacterized protein LOC110379423 n=1 Tax=Helicoverpa armigera TaxID=29058 RepID=UPI00308306EC